MTKIKQDLLAFKKLYLSFEQHITGIRQELNSNPNETLSLLRPQGL